MKMDNILDLKTYEQNKLLSLSSLCHNPLLFVLLTAGNLWIICCTVFVQLVLCAFEKLWLLCV